MVALNNTNQTQGLAEFVCPVCFKSIKPAVIDPPQMDTLGILRRAYTTWCEPCGGHVVIQFLDSQLAKWVIEKYGRLEPLYIIKGCYTQVCDARPIAAQKNPVISTGPGGDYRNEISDAQVKEFLDALGEAGQKIQAIIGSILKKQ
jgi:hypothetical protein